jgi:hypothetical protein
MTGEEFYKVLCDEGVQKREIRLFDLATGNSRMLSRDDLDDFTSGIIDININFGENV